MPVLHVRIKRIYESPEAADGKRILVDRLWPRGLSKEKALLCLWMREVAPSPDLRKWFAHRPERFAEFRELYQSELLTEPVKREKVEELRTWASKETVTLLFAAQNPTCNHAVVLQETILMSPPPTAGCTSSKRDSQ